MGNLIRLCLHHDIQVWFIPPGEPWWNGVVESFNNHWDTKFLRRVEMGSEEELLVESLRFEERHNSRYRYSKLGGKTPTAALEASGAALRFPSSSEAPRYPLAKPQQGRLHLIPSYGAMVSWMYSARHSRPLLKPHMSMCASPSMWPSNDSLYAWMEPS